MAGMIKYLQSFRFKGLTVILGVFLAISVVLWTERSGIQYQAEIKKNAYLDRDTVVTETQAVKNIESSCLVLMDSSQADSVVAWEEFERIFMDMKTGVDLADIRQSEIPDFSGYETIVVLMSDLNPLKDVGVLTQYQPLRLNTHIGIGIPWDLDRNEGGVTVLPPYEKSTSSEWYTGTANAIFQNMDYMEQYNPDYVLILSGDHIYKMDYEVMLDFHKANKADVTIACMPVPIEEASRFGIMVTDDIGRITEFEEKPEHPSSNLASMGIYIFSWPALKEALMSLKDQNSCDFGKHVLPYCKEKGERLFAYEYNGYWKDVGTLGSYWEANMELIDIIPEFNLYEEFWKIYTKGDIIPPQYISADAVTDRCLIGEGAEIYGEIHNSVIGPNVVIGKGSVIRDSIIMRNSTIGEGVQMDKAIIAEDVTIGNNVVLGCGEEAPNVLKPAVYAFGIATVGERSVIPDNVRIGKNTAISGITVPEDYPDGELAGGQVITAKDGDE